MRVLFLSRRYFPAISGMSVYASNLLRELVALGFDVTMVSQYRGDAFGRGVYGGGPPPPVQGVRVIGLEALGEQDGGDFERDIDAMVDAIAAEHARAPFDVLHAQYGYPNGWAVQLAANRLGVPTVVSIQGGDGHWVGSCCEAHRLAMVRTLDAANAVLIGGASFRAEVCERLGTDPARFTLVPGAVDTARFAPVPDWAPGRAADPLRLLYHGRVDRRKGVLDFVDALALLRDAGTPFAATISGIGPDVEPAKALAAARGLGAPALTFLGYVDYEAVPALYRAADAFVSPTYSEGFSNTILEAMAAGLPVVSTHSVGVSDCLRDGENGLMVEPGDVPALAGALGRVIADGALRRRLATAALEECRRVYSWRAVGGQIAGIYESLRGAVPARIDPALPGVPCRYRDAPHLL